MPDSPGAWLVAVAMNLFRNVKTSRSRRVRLLTPERGARVHSDAAPSPDAAVLAREVQQRVRESLDALPERERRLLLLRVEGYSYREIALALEINESSIGTLLARAERAFRERCPEVTDAS